MSTLNDILSVLDKLSIEEKYTCAVYFFNRFDDARYALIMNRILEEEKSKNSTESEVVRDNRVKACFDKDYDLKISNIKEEMIHIFSKYNLPIESIN